MLKTLCLYFARINCTKSTNTALVLKGFMLFSLLIPQLFGSVYAKDKPNIIVVLVDDLGYQDLSSYGSPDIKTPNLDNMAQNGVKFTNAYVASSVCSSSRASLLTGRLGVRNGTTGVYFPDEKGLKPSEVTIAEMLKANGYHTALYGKWHLGDTADTLPTAQGFDEYYGIPYSNDMYIGSSHSFATDVKFNQGYSQEKALRDQQIVTMAQSNGKRGKTIREHGLWGLVPIFEADEIVEYPAEQTTITKRYFDRAIEFIDKKKSSPFFIYLTPAMPHIPLFASKQFEGVSERGIYGDVVEEIDWNMGRLLKHLQKKGIAENTLVIFASDNGPWLTVKKSARGSALPLRDGKFTNFEGGVRVPFIATWPSVIKAKQVSDDVISTLDILPTISRITHSTLPKVMLDGNDISNHLMDSQLNPLSRDLFFYSMKDAIGSIRQGDWKYTPKGKISRHYAKKPEYELAWLVNLKTDISERENLINQYPDKVKQLKKLLDDKNKQLKR